MGFVKTDTIGITIMSEKIIKWGFIGCGEVTKTKSGPAFQKVEHSEVVAVMSRDGAKAKAYAKERGIKKWYDDAQELIDDPEVNAIYIATPPSSHATYAIMAMKAGKPAYIEKPMAQTYEECTRINRISQETGIPCFVAYYRRYLPYFQKVKELVENGSIGNVINVQIRLLLRSCPASDRFIAGYVRLHSRSKWLQEQPRRTLSRRRYLKCLLPVRQRIGR